MHQDEKNAESKTKAQAEHEELKFFFTPTDGGPAADAARDENPHAKSTTQVPDLVEALKEAFGEAVLRVEQYAGEDTVFVAKDRIREVCRALKDEHDFRYLSDLGGIDRFTEEERYEVFYNLISFEPPRRLRLKVRVEEDDPHVPSVSSIYRAANWNEREAYDMFGLQFDDHPDPRRMYMPEDFEYYPLRKEFPLLGVPGSLPLPPQTPEGELTYDPFAAAHGSQPVKSYDEPRSDIEDVIEERR